MKDNLSIIDADTIIYIATYNKDKEVNFSDAIINCHSVFTNIMKNTNANFYLGFLSDGSFRKKIGISKEYKGNRKDFIRPKYYDLCRAWLIEELGFYTMYNYEADDLCIMANNNYKEEYNITICSPDKDLRQVEGKFFDYKYNRFFEIDKVQANKNLWYQILVGDVIDNISGCKGIGKSKAEVLLNNVQNPWALRSIVFDKYVQVYGEYEGILKFTENYRLCKMLDKTLGDAFYQPAIFKYERQDGEEW